MNTHLNTEHPLDSYIGNFSVTEQISLQMINNRGGSSKKLNSDDIVSVVFEDNTQWFSYTDDLYDIYDSSVLEKHHSLRASPVIPLTISVKNNRSFSKNSIEKLNIYSRNNNLIDNIFEYFDKKIMPESVEGLFEVGKNFEKERITSVELKGKKVLLFIHGTFSSFDKAFRDLKDTEMWKHLFSKYDKVLAFNHKTISKSPLENASALLNSLPDEIDIDIITHSRGGLLADVICRYDRRNSQIGFSDDEINILVSSIPEEHDLIDPVKPEKKRRDLFRNDFKDLFKKKIYNRQSGYENCFSVRRNLPYDQEAGSLFKFYSECTYFFNRQRKSDHMHYKRIPA